MCAVVKLQVGDRARGGTNVVPIHATEQTDKRFGAGKDQVNVGFLVSYFRTPHLHKSNIVGPGLQAKLTKPRGFHNTDRDRQLAGSFAFTKLLYRRVLFRLSHCLHAGDPSSSKREPASVVRAGSSN